MNKVDGLDGQVVVLHNELERRLATPVLSLSEQEGEGGESLLLSWILDACPSLALPLGREMPAVRNRAASRLIRQTAFLSALTGLEPVPLLDIPIQLAAQMRMLLKLVALHGRLEAGDGSRELLAAVAGGLGVRLAAQQAAKLVPLLGWVVSGLLSGLTTWLLGQAAVAYLDGMLEERAQVWRRGKITGRRAKRERIGARLKKRLPVLRGLDRGGGTADRRAGRERIGWKPGVKMPFPWAREHHPGGAIEPRRRRNGGRPRPRLPLWGCRNDLPAWSRGAEEDRVEEGL